MSNRLLLIATVCCAAVTACSHAVEGTNRPAPELQTLNQWKNSRPLTLAALRGRYVLLEFWAHWCGPCVQDVPPLMVLHEAFADRGLVVIGLHDASVQSVVEMDGKLSRIRRALWMGHDLNYPVAIDKPGMAGPNVQGQKGSGATARAYGVSRFPTTLLIDTKGNMVGEFQAPSLDMKIAKLEKLLGLKAKQPAWRAEFDRVYRLDKAELLRHIPHPFIQERREFFFDHYIRSGIINLTPAKHTLEPPPAVILKWEEASQRVRGGHAAPTTVLDVLRELGFAEREIQGDAALLDHHVAGDWIWRAGARREDLLAAFGRVLQERGKLPLRFTSSPAKLHGFKATGAFQLVSSGGESAKGRDEVHLFTDQPDPPERISGGGGGGDLGDFLNYLGQLGGVLITNQTDSTEAGHFRWRQHNSAKQARFRHNPGLFKELLNQVSQQTGLHFESMQHVERVWMIQRQNTIGEQDDSGSP